MPNRDLIVVGASAGGIEALQRVCAALPSNLNAAVLVVMHLSASANGMLPTLLSRAGPLAAGHPEDGERIEKGRIYVAPPDFHMIVETGRLRVVHGPRENHSRPAIDPTFRSAAVSYGRRVIGVVLTGLLDDGTAGLMVIRAHGGHAIVEDPRSALFPAMPQNALERVPDADVAPLAQIPVLLEKLIAEQLEPAQPSNSSDPLAESETRLSEIQMAEMQSEAHPGKPSEFACPECGGVLWEIEHDGMLRFRCRVGHAFTAQHLDAEQRQAIETALWSALRALEESVSLYRRMAERTCDSNHPQSHNVFRQRAENAQENAKNLREFLVHIGAPELEAKQAA